MKYLVTTTTDVPGGTPGPAGVRGREAVWCPWVRLQATLLPGRPDDPAQSIP